MTPSYVLGAGSPRGCSNSARFAATNPALDQGPMLGAARLRHPPPRFWTPIQRFGEAFHPNHTVQGQLPPQVVAFQFAPRRLVAQQHGTAVRPRFHHSVPKILVRRRHQKRVRPTPNLAKLVRRHGTRAPPSTLASPCPAAAPSTPHPRPGPPPPPPVRALSSPHLAMPRAQSKIFLAGCVPT